MAASVALALKAPAPLAAEGPEGVHLTLYKIWASEKPKPAALPEDLKKYAKLLSEKARTPKKRFNNFELDGKAEEKTVEAGKQFTQALPNDYQLRLTPRKDGDAWVLDYELSRTKDKWSSKLRIEMSKDKPCVILPPIQKGEDQMVLLLIYRLPEKKEAGSAAGGGDA